MSVPHATNRSRRGNTIAELPAVLIVLFMFLTFPLLDLATVTLRYTYLTSMSRDAAHEAAKAKSFLVDSSPTQPSATNAAQTWINMVKNNFQGVVVDTLTTNIVITDIGTQTVTRQTLPLAAPADTAQNLYAIETVVTGRCFPIINFGGSKWFPAVPGLSGPMSVTVSSQEMCENTQGLTQ